MARIILSEEQRTNIIKKRTEAGISAKELSLLIGKSSKWLTQIENSRAKSIKDEDLLKINKVIEMRMNYSKIDHSIDREKRMKERQITELGTLNLSLSQKKRVWVYLNKYDDERLDGEYIYNYGEMNDSMKDGIGMEFKYIGHTQRIIEMNYEDFKVLFEKQLEKEKELEAKYPGIIIRK